MNLDNLTQWKCKNGHVLGVVERTRNGQRHVTRLMLFRQAIDLHADGATEIEVIANIEGTTLDVRCSVPGCGQMRSWFVGEEALARLLEKAQALRDAGKMEATNG